MSLSAEEVQKVAKLARIHLSEEEVQQFKTQLSAILDYVELLQKVNTQGIEETAQVTGLENVFRKDEIADISESEKEGSISQAPERTANLVKVKSVF